MPKPFRPSNGTHGGIFMEHFCFRCERDRPYREDPDGGHEGCRIMAYSMAYNLGDPEYPKEWIIDDDAHPGDIGGPHGARCTAFVPEGREIPYRCPDTLDLFTPDKMICT